MNPASDSYAAVDCRQTVISAGLLMYRQTDRLEVLLAHPGGPYYEKKDAGYWGIPKGMLEQNEGCFDAAIREFTEETGITPGKEEFIPLGTVRHPSGKTVHAWAFQGNWDDTQPIVSNTFCMEWPPSSGIIQQFPEIDKACFFPIDVARTKMNPAQLPFLDRLVSFFTGQSAGKNAG